ncbi:MAG: 6-carboxytetrahydropterin synthase [Campylobacterales bacterium]
MIIRKLFKFEASHIVRNCTTRRCSRSLHGHSYKVEVKLHSNFLDRGGMVYDFGLMKREIGDFIDSFDHSLLLWKRDNPELLEFGKSFSERWILLPINPSAEQLGRLFFLVIDKILKQTLFQNRERGIQLYSIVIHETETGYAECFREDAYNFAGMGEIKLEEIIFSPQIQREWRSEMWWERLLKGELFQNPPPH